MSTDTAIADAIKNLPKWWDIWVGIKRGVVFVELLDDTSESVNYGMARDAGSVESRINAALAIAQDYVDDNK